MNYLEQATSQIRENLTKGMTPSPSQLEKYVNKLVDRMQYALYIFFRKIINYFTDMHNSKNVKFRCWLNKITF